MATCSVDHCGKGVSAKGLCSRHYREAHQLGGQSKDRLTPDDVREIRRLSAEGVNRWDLAFKYNVTAGTITSVTSRRAWADID